MRRAADSGNTDGPRTAPLASDDRRLPPEGDSSPLALSDVDRNVLEAVRLREQGHSWRAIAARLGVDPSNLRKQALARGHSDTVAENRRAYFAAQFTAIADEANRQLLARLENGEPLGPRDLAIVGGIATDKLAAAEAWNRPASEPGNWIEGLAAALQKLGPVRLELAPALPPPIDVTPRRRDRG